VGSTCRIFFTAAGIVLYIFKFMALRFSGLGSGVRLRVRFRGVRVISVGQGPSWIVDLEVCNVSIDMGRNLPLGEVRHSTPSMHSRGKGPTILDCHHG
jgi:hypothetical protein